MIRDERNIIPMTLAVLVHVTLFGGLFVALDFSSPAMPAMPLAIKGTLVTDNAVSIPPPVVKKMPPPVAESPPDNSEQLRKQAEEQKLIEDVRIEEQRLSRIAEQEAEKKRVADEAEKKRRAADAEKKRLADEAERERKLAEAEQKRQDDIRRQREENERQRLAEATAMRETEMQAESDRRAAMNSDEMAAYMYALQQQVERNWVKPASAPSDLVCRVRIKQVPGGEVISATILDCNGDAAVIRTVKAAIFKASPLPSPSNPILFDPNLVFDFTPVD